jgi:hypothetical protein
MKNGRVLMLVVFCFLIALLGTLPAAAQSAPLVAFVSSSGQLIVSSGDGSYRWIVTNPGETLAGDPTWSANGSSLYFAVNTGSEISLRAANVSQQNIAEIGKASGRVFVISPDGSAVFYQQNDGSFALLTSGGTVPLPISNDYGARYNGLWADAAPLVAYWGYAGNSTLGVTNAANAQTVMLDSGRSAPIAPLAWRQGTAQLFYRDAAGSIRLADLSCLQSGCGNNPLDAAATLAAADADVTSDGTWLYYRSGDTVTAVLLTCPADCGSSAVAVAGSAAPQTSLHAANGILVYTGYAQNPNDPNDREVRRLSLGCMSNPGSCAPQTILQGAVAGDVSDNGRYVVVELASGLSSLDLSTGAQTYLSDRGAPLASAHWQ